MSATYDDHVVWGEAVRALRGMNGMTVAELATAAGITSAHLVRIEAGDRTLSRAGAGQLARALRVDPQLIFPDHC